MGMDMDMDYMMSLSQFIEKYYTIYAQGAHYLNYGGFALFMGDYILKNRQALSDVGKMLDTEIDKVAFF